MIGLLLSGRLVPAWARVARKKATAARPMMTAIVIVVLLEIGLTTLNSVVRVGLDRGDSIGLMNVRSVVGLDWLLLCGLTDFIGVVRRGLVVGKADGG